MPIPRLILPSLLLACVTSVTAGCAVCGYRSAEADKDAAGSTCAATSATTSAATCAATCAATGGATGHDRRSGPLTTAAAELYRRGCRAADRGDESAVDDFYHAAMLAWAEMFGPRPDGSVPCPPRLGDGELLQLYNDAAGRCVEEGWRFDRLDLAGGLTVRTAAGERLVPLTTHGLPWTPCRMHELRYVDTRACRRMGCRHGRAGLGAPMLATRHRDECDPRDRFLLDKHPYAFTVILRPPTDPAGERLEFHDVLRHTDVAVADLVVPLRAEPSAAIASAQDRQSLTHSPMRNFFLPHVTRPQHRLYLLEPYQPGRIPLVLVHGFLSDPWAWSQMIDALRSDPEIMRRYQLALYFYPTSVDITLPAADLRDELRELVARLDPDGQDPAMRQMVLAGFSVGGLLSKLQVTSSGDRLWCAYSKVPFDAVELDAESRAFFARLFFFEPLPFVRRVVFLATPHDGVTLPARAARGVGRLLAGNLPRADRHYLEFRWKNPGVAREFLPRTFPSSVFSVTQEQPLLEAMQDLPFNPCVRRHTIYGEVPCWVIPERSDLVVPVESARTPGVASELRLPVSHGQVHRDKRAAVEMKAILWEHWCAATAASPAAEPIPAEPIPEVGDALPADTDANDDAPVVAPAPLP